MSLPTEAALRSALTAVLDPEVGMNIVDLGLVYGLRIGPDRVEADITMTTPSCPMGSMIVDEVRQVLGAGLPAGTDVVVNLVWEPPWDASRMSERARKHFGW
jgi:metal-sulfur cluster biosynthetic enzyme